MGHIKGILLLHRQMGMERVCVCVYRNVRQHLERKDLQGPEELYNVDK